MEKTRKQFVVFLFSLFLGYTMVYIDKISVSYSLIPIAKEWGVGPEVKGGIMQVPMGFAINKFGSRFILNSSVLGIGLF